MSDQGPDLVFNIRPAGQSDLSALDDHEKNRTPYGASVIDKKRSHLNRVLHGSKEGVVASFKAFFKGGVSKPHTNAEKPYLSLVISASPSYFRPKNPDASGQWDRDRMKAFVKKAMQWAKKEYGQDLVFASLHLDETTPHLHLVVAPTYKKLPRTPGKKMRNETDEQFEARKQAAKSAEGIRVVGRSSAKGTEHFMSFRRMRQELHKAVEDLGIGYGVDHYDKETDLAPETPKRTHKKTGAFVKEESTRLKGVALDLEDHRASLEIWEEKLDGREAGVTGREAALDRREAALGERETAVTSREAALDQREVAVKNRELGARVAKLELLEKADELTQARKEVEAEKEAAAAARAAAERIEKEAEAKALEAAEAAAAAAALREAAERDRAAAEAAREAAAGDKSRAAAALIKADVLAAQVERADVAVQAELKQASNLVRVIDAAVRGLSSLMERNGGGLLAQVMAEARRVLTSDVRVAITSLGEMLTYRRPDGDKSDATVLREEIKEAQRALGVPEGEGRGGIEAHDPFAERDASPDPAKDEGKDQAVGGGPDGP